MFRMKSRKKGILVAQGVAASRPAVWAGREREHLTSTERRRSGSSLFYALFIIAVPWVIIHQSRFTEEDLYLNSVSFTGACQGFNGVLLIEQGDSEGAAGTIFFLFVVNQLIYADKHNLLPLVHLNDHSKYVYDPSVHGKAPDSVLPMKAGMNISWNTFVDPSNQQKYPFPGKPAKIQQTLNDHIYILRGNGVWGSYFYPVSKFSPSDPSCQRLPLLKMKPAHILPGLHLHAPWAVRSWRYGGLPRGLYQPKLSYDSWFRPMRAKGHEIVKKYIRVLPEIQQLADQANPSQHCLAMHIRHSDKANKRKRIPVKDFLPFVQVYMGHISTQQQTSPSVFLATDSNKVIDNIQSNWPKEIVSHISWQNQIIRSNDTMPVFTMASHHITNTQVLTDIVAMQKCQYMLHGLSAVSEAVFYLNDKVVGINLELPGDGGSMNVEEFESMLSSLENS